MWRYAATVVAILAALVGGAVVGIRSSDDDPRLAPSPSDDRTSELFMQPEGPGARACGEYIATWLDVLHAEDGFLINELKTDVGQGPLWVAVTGAWSMALDLETRMGREEVARRVTPAIDSACENSDVRAQFLQLQSR
jgi:hypothetical protein